MVYTESDFIIPALQEMRKRSPDGITTSELIAHLREVLEPSGYDLEIANFRNDDHFSEKVRNAATCGSLDALRTITTQFSFSSCRVHQLIF